MSRFDGFGKRVVKRIAPLVIAAAVAMPLLGCGGKAQQSAVQPIRIPVDSQLVYYGPLRSVPEFKVASSGFLYVYNDTEKEVVLVTPFYAGQVYGGGLATELVNNPSVHQHFPQDHLYRVYVDGELAEPASVPLAQ